jgi:hypothetical protein
MAPYYANPVIDRLYECKPEHRDPKSGAPTKLCCAQCAINMIETLANELKKMGANVPVSTNNGAPVKRTVYRLLTKNGSVYATVSSPEAVVRRQSRGMGNPKDVDLVSSVPVGQVGSIPSLSKLQIGERQGRPVAVYRFRPEEVYS